jgi:hypothetical protein
MNDGCYRGRITTTSSQVLERRKILGRYSPPLHRRIEKAEEIRNIYSVATEKL